MSGVIAYKLRYITLCNYDIKRNAAVWSIRPSLILAIKSE